MSEDLIRYLNSFKDYKERKKMLQELAIKHENERRLHRELLRNGAIFIVAAVAIFAVIWWCGL